MTDKAYIVANGEQEREVLKKLELKGCLWRTKGIKPTEWVPSHIEHLIEFPYVLLGDGTVSWEYMYQLEDEDIVYDGRKESKMKISKEVYDALVEWRDARNLGHEHIDGGDLLRLPTFILNFWLELGISRNEANNRLIAIIRFANGEDVFEVEKPKKWVVRSKEKDGDGEYWYVSVNHVSPDFYVSEDMNILEYVTKFDTKEEAESWANSHQEVVQVEVKE